MRSTRRVASVLGLVLAAACSSDAGVDAGHDAGADTGRDLGVDTGVAPFVFTASPDPAERSDCTTRPAAGVARAKHVTCPAELVPGSLAMGRLGDIVIENARSRFIVRTGDESASTIGGFSGGLVDAAAGAGVDQLKEIMPLLDFAVARASSIVVTDAGDDGEARVTVLFDAAPLGLLQAAVPGLSHPLPARGAIDYVLGGDADALVVRMRISPEPGVVSVTPRPGFVVLLGGNGELEQPGHGVLLDGDAPNDTPLLLTEGAAESIAVGLSDDSASLLSVNTIHLLQAATRLAAAAGETDMFEARIAVTDTAAEAWRAATTATAPILTLHGAVGDRVEIASGAQTVIRTRFATDGTARVPLASGDYVVRSGFDGFFPGTDTPATVAASGSDVTVPAPPSGVLSIDATAGGVVAPARIRVRDVATGDDVLRFVANGPTSRRLPPGTYTLSASRGLEYDVQEQSITISDGATLPVTVVLDRAIDTTGYISADFHLHSDLSTDSVHHVEDAVRIIAAEGLELVASTDHDYVTDYAPITTRAGVASWLVVVPGDEVSSTVLGHFGGYPLLPDPDHAGAGAPVWFDRSPRDIFDMIRARGDTAHGGAIVQVNHPRLRGTSFFDKVGLDVTTGHATASPTALGLPATTDLDDFSFDVVEVWNGYTRGDNESSFESFLALAAHGRPFTMVGNSDSHRASLPAGSPRSFLRVPDDTAGHFRWEDAAVALHAGGTSVTVAAGIFITADLAGPRAADSVPVHVRVQAPPWVEVNRLRIYAGTTVAVDQPIGASSAAVRLDTTLAVPLSGAAFIVARADGDADAEPVFPFSPYGVTNPITVP